MQRYKRRCHKRGTECAVDEDEVYDWGWSKARAVESLETSFIGVHARCPLIDVHGRCSTAGEVQRWAGRREREEAVRTKARNGWLRAGASVIRTVG